jgi:hypothetical protein
MSTKAGKFAKMGALIGGVFGVVQPIVSLVLNKNGRQAAMDLADRRGISHGAIHGFWAGLIAINGLLLGAAGAAIGAITGLFFKNDKDKKVQMVESAGQPAPATSKLDSSSEQQASDVTQQSQKAKPGFRDKETVRTAAKDTADHSASL